LRPSLTISSSFAVPGVPDPRLVVDEERPDVEFVLRSKPLSLAVASLSSVAMKYSDISGMPNSSSFSSKFSSLPPTPTMDKYIGRALKAIITTSDERIKNTIRRQI
jgi:hypothetical protein